jgi:ABC-2 type transport system permease protein
MRNTWAVCKREFSSYFVTPVGYVVVGIFAAVTGIGFAASFLFYSKVSMNPSAYAYSNVPDFEETLLGPFLVFCGLLVMFIAPLVTMRLLAEERNRGTMELLLTQPLRDREIVFGKYFASLGMLLVMLAVIGIDLIIMAFYVNVEPTVLIFGLISVFLMGAAFLSLGLFVSAMTNNQITAGTLTFGLSLVLYVVGSFAGDLPKKNPSPESWGPALRALAGTFYNFFRNLAQQLAFDGHAKEMTQGVLRPEDIAYYLLVAAFFLFLTFRALESRKWRA